MEPLPDILYTAVVDHTGPFLHPEFRYSGQGEWNDSPDNCYVYASNGRGAALTYGFRKLFETVLLIDDYIESGSEIKLVIQGASHELNRETYYDLTVDLYEIPTSNYEWVRIDPSTPWWGTRKPVATSPLEKQTISVREYLAGRKLAIEWNWFRQAGSARW